MPETGKPTTKLFNGLFWVAIAAVVVYLIARNFGVFSNVVIVMLGFGAVILVHEFGHFIIAKLSGIKVEAFSIFMPPTLLGIRKTRSGFKLRFLPSLTSRDEDESAEKPEETEYRIGLIPFGGYVKLLGQEDTGPAKQVNDPRSFACKPISSRIAVISAGVTFNVISAVIIFMIVFLIGIELAPPVVGGVAPGSPAAQAGLQAGDVFVEIDGQTKDLDFSNIMIASALSDVGRPVPVTVRRPDGTIEEIKLVAKEAEGTGLREFGVLQPFSLKIAAVMQADALQARTGLLPGDRIVAVNGRDVEHHWDFAKVVSETLAPAVTVVAERSADGETKRVETTLPLDWAATRTGEAKTDADLNHVYSIVPRLRVVGVSGESAVEGDAAPQQGLQTGDILLEAAQTRHPTYRELREITVEYEGKPLPLKVLRADANGVEQEVALAVTPRREPTTGRIVIGFLPALDAKHAIVADTISVKGGPAKLEIPRGARIVSVNNAPVSSFYDLIQQVRQWEGQTVTLQYQLDTSVEGGAPLSVGTAQHPIAMDSMLAEAVPFAPLQELYQAHGPLNAIGMGYRRTVMFIAQTYVTLKQLVTGLISPKHLMGPLGIMTFSYQIVKEQPFINYIYFLGLISATIAVLNFLPIPPFDGGLVVLMIIEKIRGVALSERAQGIIAYASWVMVLALLVYVTFNDIVRTVRTLFS